MPYKGRRTGGRGSAGGKAVFAKYGRAHMGKIGSLGAQALLDQHGTEHMSEIGQNGYYKVMKRYGVERPPPPIAWNDRQRMIEQEREEQAVAEQSALFLLDDTRKAA